MLPPSRRPSIGKRAEQLAVRVENIQLDRQLPINMSVTQAAKSLIHDGKYDQGVLNTVEMSIRAYDPCFSCATHRLDGKLSVKLDILDADGKLMGTLAN